MSKSIEKGQKDHEVYLMVIKRGRPYNGLILKEKRLPMEEKYINPHKPDLRPFLKYVEDELGYLQENDLSYEPELLKAAGALVVLQEYLQKEIE